MPIAITQEHRELADVVARLLADADVRAVGRAALDEQVTGLSEVWQPLADQGWLGVHVPEACGGGGGGLPELAIVAEQLGAAAAPGPFPATLAASAALATAGVGAEVGEALRALATGATSAVVALGDGLTRDGGGALHGSAPGLGLASAGVVLVAVDDDLVVLTADQVDLRAAPVIDAGLATVRLTIHGATPGPGRTLISARSVALRALRLVLAATAAGVARSCVDMAVDYAKVRQQFGRPIAAFQAIKHHCARMLADSERATAVAWDAARSPLEDPLAGMATATAAVVALDAAVACAETNLQVHGGIGYTWEHDVHLYLRRATAMRALADGLPDAAAEVTAWTRQHGARTLAVDLPADAESFRQPARAAAAAVAGLAPDEARRQLARSGYLVAHWPPPWGLGAGAVEQLVIEEELAGVERPSLGITGWVVLTIAQHGTDDQRDRWVMPALEGDVRWCQLFSEPEAGSDAAAVRTRAERVDGGWVVSGQKVWTSQAAQCAWGLATVRTNPDAPKHKGITTMAVDLTAEGVTIRPLREITGNALFNEVFLDDVFVPDRDVVGGIDDGWRVARDTLGNERVSIGGASVLPFSVVDLARGQVDGVAPTAADDVGLGRLIADDVALRLLNLRAATRVVAGGPPGAEGNVAKLLGALHEQDVAGLGLRLSARDGGGIPSATTHQAYLYARCLTIAGGTTEVVSNVVAERLLGMPRDPLPTSSPQPDGGP